MREQSNKTGHYIIMKETQNKTFGVISRCFDHSMENSVPMAGASNEISKCKSPDLSVILHERVSIKT